jgi:hypothetical protein
MTASLFLTNQDFNFGGADPGSPDYVCAAFNEMSPRWQLVEDIRGGTAVIRMKRESYLPKFEAETQADWDGRVLMTFVADHYATTLTEHVGLVMAVPPKLGDDVPEAIRTLTEDIDGEGNHLDVFAWDALEKSMHFGHGVFLTDYPQPEGINDLTDQRHAKVRPYATFYRACDVLSWQWAAIGGVQIIVQIVLRETGSEPAGEFGVKQSVTLREFKQDVTYNQFTGRATALGAINWRTWKETTNDAGRRTYTPLDGGQVIGPKQIPARVVYGGERIAILHSKPHLIGLAFSNVEEVQVGSDYANVMHKCNVPTPIFIGRNVGDAASKTVQMGQGIDVPIGGDAKMLEPAGTAIGATRQRLQDIQAQMRRQGATMDDATGSAKTAAEARLYAKQRNAKIARAARSLQDALEGVFEDMAAFLKLPNGGGSVVINQDFAGEGLDPALLTVYLNAYTNGALPLDALMYALEKGRLPEDFQAEDQALTLVADEMARRDAELAAEKKRLEAPAPTPAPAPAPGVAA